MAEHEYPPRYQPGTHWATDAAWEILDMLNPGRLTILERSLIAGLIAGRLIRERAIGSTEDMKI